MLLEKKLTAAHRSINTIAIRVDLYRFLLRACSFKNNEIAYGVYEKATKLKITIFGIPNGSMPKLGKKKILVKAISPVYVLKLLYVIFVVINLIKKKNVY